MRLFSTFSLAIALFASALALPLRISSRQSTTEVQGSWNRLTRSGFYLCWTHENDISAVTSVYTVSHVPCQIYYAYSALPRAARLWQEKAHTEKTCKVLSRASCKNHLFKSSKKPKDHAAVQALDALGLKGKDCKAVKKYHTSVSKLSLDMVGLKVDEKATAHLYLCSRGYFSEAVRSRLLRLYSSCSRFFIFDASSVVRDNQSWELLIVSQAKPPPPQYLCMRFASPEKMTI